MGIFDDQKYENMDWLSQTVEPYEWSLNEYLSKLPEQWEFKYDKIVEVLFKGHWKKDHIAKSDIVFDMLKNTEYYDLLSQQPLNLINNSYDLCCDNLVDLNLEEQTGPVLYIKKNKPMISDKEMIDYVKQQVRGILDINYTQVCLLNEICDTVDAPKEYKSTRNLKRKREILIKRVQQIIDEDIWRIRNIDLILKIIKWISDYISNGNIAALANLSKIKVMTHKELPIYSMEEIV